MANSRFPVNISRTNNSSVLDAMVSGTIPGAWGPAIWWSQTITYQDFDETDTSELLVLNTQFPQNRFPSNVRRGTVLFELVQTFGGGTINAVTMTVGGTWVSGTSANSLVTSQNIFTGQTTGTKVETTGASLFASRYEPAGEPSVTLATTAGNIDTLTSGIVRLHILYWPVPVL